MESTSIEMSKSQLSTDQSESLLGGKNADPSSPVNTANISWQGISASTKQGKRCFKVVPPKAILKSVSGKVDSGQLLAVMGPSGSGKTTLLNVLTGRNLSQYDIEGTVLVNGSPARIDTMKSLSGYVQQGSIFVPQLTVKEYLVFQSLVRMDSHLSPAERSQRIEEVITELGLGKVANTRIGNRYDDLVGSGISGGELRRLSLAAEILTNPPLIICDEPTSGLDSYLAENVVNMMKNLAHSGRTVICTIHQPSSEVFILFDRLLLLAEGQVAFMGSLAEAQEHFTSLRMVVPQNFNPADFYLRLLSTIPGNEVECEERIKLICGSYREKQREAAQALEVNGLKGGDGVQPPEEALKTSEPTTTVKVRTGNPYKATWCGQFRALLWRSFITNSREPMITRIKLSQTITVALLLGIVYWSQPNEQGQYDQKAIMNINGAIFILIINLTFMNIFSVVNTFCSELSIFLREHNDGMYRVDTYFLSKQAAELPFQILMPTVLVMILYQMIGFNSSMESYLLFLFVSNLIANCGISFGYMISCMSSSTKMAIALSSPLILPLLLFGGFFINNNSIPIYFEVFKYISWFYYGNEALVIAQWKNVDNIICEKQLAQQSNSTAVSASAHSTSEHRCLHHGSSIIEELSFNVNNSLLDMCCLVTLIIAMRAVAFIALLHKSKKR